jgi:copper chaperone CopZ
MLKKIILCSWLVGSLSIVGTAAPTSKSTSLLKTGTYSAEVKAIVCGGCASFIQEALSSQKAIENVSVDAKTKKVTFSVKAGSEVNLSDLQQVLKASADKMGMGANYALSQVKRLSK